MLELGVLLVEDNPSVLSTTQRMLTNIGCTVYDANHPKKRNVRPLFELIALQCRMGVCDEWRGGATGAILVGTVCFQSKATSAAQESHESDWLSERPAAARAGGLVFPGRF
jgi:hypothetical protein